MEIALFWTFADLYPIKSFYESCNCYTKGTCFIARVFGNHCLEFHYHPTLFKISVLIFVAIVGLNE